MTGWHIINQSTTYFETKGSIDDENIDDDSSCWKQMAELPSSIKLPPKLEKEEQTYKEREMMLNYSVGVFNLIRNSTKNSHLITLLLSHHLNACSFFHGQFIPVSCSTGSLI